MSMKVEVQDYQIIKKAKAEFIPGLNIIIGPSNNGKTSLIKAIKSLLYTEPGNTPIRNGQPNYKVGLEYNGHRVILQKGKDSFYSVDGEKYSKYGTSTPEEVSNALEIRELVLNGNKEQINFWNQMNYPFLLDKGSTDLFRFIVDSGDSDKVSESLKSIVKDRQTLEKKINEYQSNILMLDGQINDLEDKTKNSDIILDTCNKIIEMQSKINRLRTLEQIKENITFLNTKKNDLNVCLETVNNSLNPIIKQLKSIIETYKNMIEHLKSKITLNRYLVSLEELKVKSNELDKLPKIQISTDKYNKLMEKSEVIKRIQENIKSKSSLIIPDFKWTPHKYDYYDLLSIYDKLTLNYGLKIYTLESSKSIVNEDISLINSVLKHIEICPLCGNKINFKEVKI